MSDQQHQASRIVNGVKVNAAIVYHSFSGNTEEVAELIERKLLDIDWIVSIYKIGSGFIPDLSNYDICFFGTFTWEKGRLPDETEDFLEFNNLPSNTALFGTGDTQFGGDRLFCKALDVIASTYRTPYIPLKIEQSPRGAQESKVFKWVGTIIEKNKGDNLN